jgi:DNA polymerase-3 subunit beta
MNITILKDNLAKGLSLVSRAVSSRSTLPVLNNILIAADGSRLRLSATNLAVAITCWLDANVDAGGAITVPAKTLTDVVAAIASGDSVSLTLKKDTLTLKTSVTKTEIKGISADEFPIIPRGEALEAAAVEFEITALRDAIRKTAFCAATDEARPILTGVLCHADNGRGTLAATDGFRLSVAQVTVNAESPNPTPSGIKVIIPAETLAHLDRVLGDESRWAGEGTVTMRVPHNQNQVIFTTETVELVSQLVEGKFPNYEEVIPKKSKLTVEVNAAELLTAVKAVDIFARENDHTARFTFDESGLRLLGQSAETGSGEARVSARFAKGAPNSLPVEISFNAKYMIEALKAFDGQCAIGLTGPRAPALLTPPAGGGLEMVIMPMLVDKPAPAAPRESG